MSVEVTERLPDVCLRLRDGLNFLPRLSDGDAHYVVEDLGRATFYRLGVAEYQFISLLDGRTTFAQAVQYSTRQFGEHAFSGPEAAAICRWLIQNDLARAVQAASDPSPAAGNRADEARIPNPLAIRIPFGNPNRLVGRLLPALGWLFSAPVTCFALAVVLYATSAVLAEWPRFADASRGVFAPSNWLLLIAISMALKVVHELAHAIVCKRYGGDVTQVGILLVLFAPLAFVDVTSSWRFSSRWQRIHTSLAGIYIELLIAASAAIAWTRTSSEALAQVLYNIILLAGIATLVFNANPLMRFDGYYVLADLVGIPNLYHQSQHYTRWLGKRLLLGPTEPAPFTLSWQDLFICVYGVLAYVWKVFIGVCLILVASELFHGAGILLAAVAVVAWFAPPIKRMLDAARQRLASRHGAAGKPASMPARIGQVGAGATTSLYSILVRGAILAAILVAIGFGLAWPMTLSLPGVVEEASPVVLRAPASGFVVELFVADGQAVSAGQPILRLVDDELDARTRDVALAIGQSELQARVQAHLKQTAGYQMERENLAALQKRRRDLEQRQSQMTCRAPAAGVISRPRLDSLLGAYVKEGDELTAILAGAGYRFVTSIEQRDVDRFAAAVGKPAHVALRDGSRATGRVEQVDPRANRQPRHDALSAVNGGPLVVQTVRRKEAKAEHDTEELVEPRFTGYIALPPASAGEWKVGQIGWAKVASAKVSLARRVIDPVSRWIRERVSRRSSASQAG